jgi:hypothetical protein
LNGSSRFERDGGTVKNLSDVLRNDGANWIWGSHIQHLLPNNLGKLGLSESLSMSYDCRIMSLSVPHTGPWHPNRLGGSHHPLGLWENCALVRWPHPKSMACQTFLYDPICWYIVDIWYIYIYLHLRRHSFPWP